jgi:hypothetical protein
MAKRIEWDHENVIMKSYPRCEIFTFFDCPSNKGFPTNKSVVVTVVCDRTGRYGIAVKVAGDVYIPRIAEAIAFKQIDTQQRYIPVKDWYMYFMLTLFDRVSESVPTLSKRTQQRVLNMNTLNTYRMWKYHELSYDQGEQTNEESSKQEGN